MTTTTTHEMVTETAIKAHTAAGTYYDGSAPWEPVEGAFAAFERACAEARRAHDAARPAGKLPKGHPWTAALVDLGEHIKINRALVEAMYFRAKAKRAGRIDRYDSIRDQDLGRTAAAADCARGVSIPTLRGPREAYELATR